MRSHFHLAYNVRDLDDARRFYRDVLGCREGRSAPTWVDFDFFGHEISLHLGEPFPTARTGRVGDHLAHHVAGIVGVAMLDLVADGVQLLQRRLTCLIERDAKVLNLLAMVIKSMVFWPSGTIATPPAPSGTGLKRAPITSSRSAIGA